MHAEMQEKDKMQVKKVSGFKKKKKKSNESQIVESRPYLVDVVMLRWRDITKQQRSLS